MHKGMGLNITGDTDRFFVNFIAGAMIACWAMLTVEYLRLYVPGLREATQAARMGVAFLLAEFGLFVLPLVWTNLLNAPRRLLFHEEKKRPALWGRSIGCVLGLIGGLALIVELR